VLAIALTKDDKQPESTVKPRASSAARTAKLAQLAKADEVPEDKKVAEGYAENRWGHLGEELETLPHLGDAGVTIVQPTRVWVGINGKGEKVYMRALAKPYFDPNLKKLDFSNSKFQPPILRVKDYKPGPILQKLKGIKHIDDPDDMPEGMEQQHPLYQPPADSGPGASASGEQSGE
jgi:hypothetical protein